MEGDHAILNGKVLAIKRKNKFPVNEEYLEIIDVSTDEVIWKTSTILRIEDTDLGIKIHTRNSVYEFINIKRALPTMPSSLSIKKDEEFEELVIKCRLEILEEKLVDRRDIHYRDGYGKWEITFDRPTNEEEIRDFLRDKGWCFIPKKEADWYEDYADLVPISDDNSKWEYTHWKRYTD